ncbi:DUF2243 domain-containing protein [Streptosporangium amethystogenes]|uniref:DUF2243 domain-containing protein n=1 Tax=Streptosporangium amethystogenes TaxID=2002 RepID=UPI0037936E74
MPSGRYPGDTHINMIGDGLFHLGYLIVVVIGVLLLSATRRARTMRRIGGPS